MAQKRLRWRYALECANPDCAFNTNATISFVLAAAISHNGLRNTYHGDMAIDETNYLLKALSKEQ
jgi:hypothetical protein